MSNETQSKIGNLLSREEPRDAVHVAVFSAYSLYHLNPGQPVCLDGANDKVKPWSSLGLVKPIGVVDPFIRHRVSAGSYFYVFVYPNTIINLNHNWTHPLFLKTDERPDKQMGEAEEWLRAFCVMYKADFDELIESVVNGGNPNRSEGPSFGTDRGADLLRERDYEFWYNVEEFTGKKFSDDHKELVASNTSCAC